MPSPIAHTAMGYVIYRIYQARLSQQNPQWIEQVPYLPLVTTGLSLLPDLDVIPGILLGDINQFHNNLTHSFSSGLIAALGIGGLFWLRQRSGFWRWFIVVLLCYELHVIMDFFTVGRGVMLFWPFSSERYEPIMKLFYGLHRSDGWISIRHLFTLVNEFGFAAFMGFSTHATLKIIGSNTSRHK